MTVYTVGIDVGESCGLAVLGDGRPVRVWQGPATLLPSELATQLERLTRDADATVYVAAERFVQPSGHVTRQNAPPEVLGVVRSVTESFGLELDLQTPADAKGMFSNAELRTLDAWVTPAAVNQVDADDARDAIRHALLLLARRSLSTLDSLLKSHGL